LGPERVVWLALRTPLSRFCHRQGFVSQQPSSHGFSFGGRLKKHRGRLKVRGRRNGRRFGPDIASMADQSNQDERPGGRMDD
jgi:hypothetical protein